MRTAFGQKRMRRDNLADGKRRKESGSVCHGLSSNPEGPAKNGVEGGVSGGHLPLPPYRSSRSIPRGYRVCVLPGGGLPHRIPFLTTAITRLLSDLWRAGIPASLRAQVKPHDTRTAGELLPLFFLRFNDREAAAPFSPSLQIRPPTRRGNGPPRHV